MNLLLRGLIANRNKGSTVPRERNLKSRSKIDDMREILLGKVKK